VRWLRARLGLTLAWHRPCTGQSGSGLKQATLEAEEEEEEEEEGEEEEEE